MLADTEMEAKEKEAEPQTNSTLPEAEAAPLCRFSPMFAFQKLGSVFVIFFSVQVVFLTVSRLFLIREICP